MRKLFTMWRFLDKRTIYSVSWEDIYGELHIICNTFREINFWVGWLTKTPAVNITAYKHGREDTLLFPAK
jgi:hypothetical protein